MFRKGSFREIGVDVFSGREGESTEDLLKFLQCLFSRNLVGAPFMYKPLQLCQREAIRLECGVGLLCRLYLSYSIDRKNSDLVMHSGRHRTDGGSGCPCLVLSAFGLNSPFSEKIVTARWGYSKGGRSSRGKFCLL